MNHSTGDNKQLLTYVVRGLFVSLLLAFVPINGLAHAKLVRSEPKARASFSTAPKLVEIWFSEELEPGLTTIEVTDQQGTRVDRGEVTLSEANKKAQIELGALSAGVYTVTWKAVAGDEHTMRGSFTFSLTTPSAAPATGTAATGQTTGTQPTSTPMPAMSPEEDQGAQISWGQTLVRWLSYLAMMTLFGGFAFRSLVLVPAFRRALEGAERAQAAAASERRALLLSWMSIVLLFFASITALVMQAANVFDKSLGESLSLDVLGRVLSTGYGPFWIFQIASVGAITLILVLLTERVRQNPSREHSGLWWAGLVGSAVLLMAPSWTGHAMVAIKHFRLAVFTDWLHLLAGGFWVGGLFHLALTLPPALPLLSKSRRTIALHHVIKSFTRVAMPSVVLLVLAGLYNTWAHIPRLQAFWMTPYGKTLGIKLLIVGVMLLLGGLNNFHFGKRAARLVAAENADSNAAEEAKLERGFCRSVAFEAALGAVVLLVTAVLVFMTPARNHPAMTAAETEQKLSR
ncbi:MAG: copper resistance protein CopC/CopD [Blastocatellia bacterium]|nr:copper resistance protein CopC/CopD [Blastocatellia bacterium]